MKNDSSKIFSGMLWRFGERITAQLISFVVSIVLARLLFPEEYGIVAMTAVFITVLNVFVTSGFGTALIQKKNADNLDFSTILVFGVVFSLVLYVCLFLTAPFVARFYQEDILEIVLRVMTLRLPIAAINSVQQAYVSRKMIFRKFFWSTLFGTLLSAVVGIAMAYTGYGVWALVGQYLTNCIVDTCVLAVTLKWWPGLKFSFARLKVMFSFGARMLFSDLLHTVYTQLRSLIIGKYYTKEQLAYYNRGQQLPHLLVTNVGVSISTVLFPAMSKEQSEQKHVINLIQKTISLGLFVMVPLMTGMFLLADPIVNILYTGKWGATVPFLQLACIEFAFEPWSSANLQAIKALGMSKTYQRLEILKKTVALILLLISVKFGVWAVAASGTVYSLIAIVLTTLPAKKHLNFGFIKQSKLIIKTIVADIAMTVSVVLCGLFPLGMVFRMLIQVVVGVIVYIFTSIMLKNEAFLVIINTIKSFFHRKSEVNL